MPINNLMKILVTLSILIINGCQQIPIEDNQFCADLVEYGAKCNNLLSQKPITYSKEEYDIIRITALAKNKPLISTSWDSYANLRKAIEKLCKDTNRCTYEEMKNVELALDQIQSTYP